MLMPSSIFVGRRIGRQIVAVSTGALNGNCATSTPTAIAGGYVEILSGSTRVALAAVDGSGNYSVSSLSPGTYSPKYHPPLTHCLGASEPDTRSVTISAGVTTTQNFVGQLATWSDDFQSYSTVADITYGSLGGHTPSSGKFAYMNGNGDFQQTKSQGDQTCTPPCTAGLSRIVYPTTEGPFSDKAVRYDYPAQSQNVPGPKRTPPAADDISNYYIELEGRVAAGILPLGQSTLHARWTDKFSSGWRCGGGTATGSQIEYKAFFINVQCPGNNYGQIHIEFDDNQTNPSGDINLRVGLVDQVGNSTEASRYNLGGSFLGAWHTWVVSISGMGTSSCTVNVYLDGVLVSTLTGPFFPGSQVLGPSADCFLELGANINNGPDAAQSRWFREVGLYKTRPSLLSLVSP